VKYYLGIDTSNYTTSLAVADETGIVENIKIPLSVKEGERGLRQSDALFQHNVNLPIAFERLGDYSFEALGYSLRPRDVEGSYMPCFLAGTLAGIAAAKTAGIKSYAFSHQAGHIRAALYSSGRENLIGSEFIAFHVSGGTTELLHVKNDTISKIGGTEDINAGQLIDRSGVLMGMTFPCGAEMERLAGEAFERPKVCVRGLVCNLSGAENKVKEFIEKGADRESVSAYVIDFVKLSLDALCENALKEYGKLPLIFAGGVMSNGIIKAYMKEKYGADFAEPQFSADNAAGTALLCRDAHRG